VGSQPASKGVTHTWRLRLTDGTLTHDAHFQPIDERKSEMKLASGTELNFVDSYKYNIAAYALPELLGMDDMVPIYVERKWNGTSGSMSWWLPWKMDEAERHKQKLTPPDPDAWNNQMYKIRVFHQLAGGLPFAIFKGWVRSLFSAFPKMEPKNLLTGANQMV
jgi:hypothetical protein